MYRVSDPPAAVRLPERLEDSDLFIRDPTTIFEIENFLPPGLYAALQRSFPHGAHFGHRYELGGKWFFNNQHPAFRRFLSGAPAWRALYAWFSSPDTLAEFKRLLDPYLLHRPAAERKDWVFVPPTWRHKQDEKSKVTAVRQGFEFSALLRGDSIPPHTDLPGKLLSLLIYFPDPDSPALESCGTSFYRAKPGHETREDWDPKMMTPAESMDFLESHEVYFRSAFTANKLVGFVKSEVSWHAVPPLEIPDGLVRKSVNLNVYLR
jgi:hypothetical protein